MYFKTKTTPSGHVIQLVESYRNDLGKPRHRIVVSLGSAKIPLEVTQEIAKLVEQRLYGYNELAIVNHNQAVAEWVDTIVRRVENDGKMASFAEKRSWYSNK